MSRTIAIDIGGTCTDFVSYDHSSGQITAWKNLTNPAKPIKGVMQGLSRLDDVADISTCRLGSTVATNTLLTRSGARVAYVTTRGFRDIPFIQTGNRKSHYDINWIKGRPLVKRTNCYEVNERISAKGEIVEPLDEDSVRHVAARIRSEGNVEAVAVCTLFSYIVPDHEQRIKAILTEELPRIPISISYEVMPKWREYRRSSTTIIDGYLKPVVANSFSNIQGELESINLGDNKISIIKSNGGEVTIQGAIDKPSNLILSGPSGAVVASRAISELTGISNLATFDMGGTSTDCSTVINSMEKITTDFEIEWGIPIQIPMIDVHTIGAGGSSIAWIDAGGMLRVGPGSAGADPGPACYGRGGKEATVTDANVVLGRINSEAFLGGEMSLDFDAAYRAVERIGEDLGLAVDNAAMAIIQITNNNMKGALEVVLLQRGLDPRDFTLIASGGAGPLHVSELMDLGGLKQGLVPNYPGEFSAFGFIMTDARVDKHRTVQQTSKYFDNQYMAEVLSELAESSVNELRDQGYSREIHVQRIIEARYLGQNYELEITYPSDGFSDEETARFWERFHKEHLDTYGFSIEGEIIEIVNLQAIAIAVSDKPTMPTLESSSGMFREKRTQKVRFDEGWIDTTIYSRSDLKAGDEVFGPSLIEEPASTTVVAPGLTLKVDKYGHLLISA